MNEFKTEKAVYTPEDFQLWDAGKLLNITPKFQRRKVWPTGTKSYFIDTLLRGMTVPPIYLRIAKGEAVREVVDGQQRISSVLDYMKGTYKLSKTLGPVSWAEKRFDKLEPEQQAAIRGFTFSCEIFRDISDSQVLEVFCRLNMNGVPLNAQELRNGKYFGFFKQLSYKLALSYLDFWRTFKVFTELGIARMQEVELTSELLIAGDAGMQDKKKSISDFYSEWEELYPNQALDEARFNATMDAIKSTFQNDPLANTEFRRPPMFYSLYCTVYHHLFGLPNVARPTPKKQMTVDERDSLRDAVSKLSEIIVQSKDPASEPPKKYAAFILHSSRQTDNIKPRETRFNTLYGDAFG